MKTLSSIEKDDLPNNSIIEIIQDDWKINEDVLRYTKIIISRVPPPPKPEPEPEPKPEEELELEFPLENKDKVEAEVVEGDEEIKKKPLMSLKKKEGKQKTIIS